MINCLFCKETHPTNACPLFAKTDIYLQTYAPKPPDVLPPIKEDAPASSLAPTQFIQLFGEGAESMLQEVLDGDEWSPEQRELAILILGGDQDIHKLAADKLDILDTITQQLAYPPEEMICPNCDGRGYEWVHGSNEFDILRHLKEADS